MRCLRSLAVAALFGGAIVTHDAAAAGDDLPAIAEAAVTHWLNDPGNQLNYGTDGRLTVAPYGDSVDVTLHNFRIVLKTPKNSRLMLGDVTLHIRRRPDGGLEAAADLPTHWMSLDDGGKPEEVLTLTDPKLTFGWSSSNDRFDHAVFNAASLHHKGAIGEITLTNIAWTEEHPADDVAAGQVAWKITGGEWRHVAVPPAPEPAPTAFGALTLALAYRDFPFEKYQILLKQMKMWAVAQYQNDNQLNGVGLMAQLWPLLMEAGTHYRLDKLAIDVGGVGIVAQGDIDCSLQAKYGLTASVTTWLSGAIAGIAVDPANAAGNPVAGLTQVGRLGTAPDGKPALEFKFTLGADGAAQLNGNDVGPVMTALSNGLDQVTAGQRPPAAPPAAPGGAAH